MLPFQHTIRNNIRQVLSNSDTSIKDAAVLIGIHPVSFSRLLNGTTPISEIHIIKLSKVLDVPPEIFFRGIADSFSDNAANRKLGRIREILTDE